MENGKNQHILIRELIFDNGLMTEAKALLLLTSLMDENHFVLINNYIFNEIFKNI